MLTEEQKQQLVVDYVPYAMKIAKRFKLSDPNNHHAIESNALLALFEAAQRWIPDIDVKFSTYASYRIRGACIDAKEGPKLGGKEIVEKVGWGHEYEDSVQVVSRRVTRTDEVENRDTFEHILGLVDQETAQILTLMCVEGLNQLETSQKLGLCQTTVSKKLAQARKFIRNHSAYNH